MLSLVTPVSISDDLRMLSIGVSLSEIIEADRLGWETKQFPEDSAPTHESRKEDVHSAWKQALGIKCTMVSGSNQKLIGFSTFAGNTILKTLLSRRVLRVMMVTEIDEVVLHCEEMKKKPVQIDNRKLHIFKCRIRWDEPTVAINSYLPHLAEQTFRGFSPLLQEELNYLSANRDGVSAFKEDLRAIIHGQRYALASRMRPTRDRDRFDLVIKFVEQLENSSIR